MNKNKKRKIKRTAANALLVGIAAALLSFLICALLGALICGAFPNPTKSIGAVAFLVLVLSGAVSGFFTSRYKGEGGVLPSFLASLVFAIIFLIVGVILSSGELPAILPINLLVYLLASLFSAFLGRKRESAHKRHRN